MAGKFLKFNYKFHMSYCHIKKNHCIYSSVHRYIYLLQKINNKSAKKQLYYNTFFNFLKNVQDGCTDFLDYLFFDFFMYPHLNNILIMLKLLKGVTANSYQANHEFYWHNPMLFQHLFYQVHHTEANPSLRGIVIYKCCLKK